jgi:hypothetical protein
MRPDAKENRLLNDVLEDQPFLAFKERLLDHCLEQVRPRYRTKILVGVLSGGAAILLLILMVWLVGHPAKQVTPKDTAPAYLIPAGAPIDPDCYVQTEPTVLAGCLIRNPRDLACLVQSQPLPASARVTESRPLQRITDTEMLALFPDSACGVFYAHEGPARFVFFNPEDETKYFKQ